MACPGHHEASIAVHDPQTGILATGDTVYPGRLYISDLPAFRTSLERLVGYADSHDVRQVLGGHIEMTREPGRDYPVGAVYQPNEPPLAMTVDQLRAVRDAAASTPDRAGVYVHDDFILFVGHGGRSMPRYIARSLWHRLSRAVAGVVPRRRRTLS
jgi:glyoxylase-like metal-dependent hydrolase (beta-lactamase superfamily II)